jgi:hypothetical protein
MSDGTSTGCAGGAAIGNQGHRFGQATARQRGCQGQHFLHARAATGAFITDYNHIAGFHLSNQNSEASRLFRFKKKRLMENCRIS